MNTEYGSEPGNSPVPSTPAPRGDGSADRVSRDGSRLRRVVGFALPPVLVLVAVVLAWMYLTYQVLTESQRFRLPPPQDVVTGGFFTWRRLSEILEGLRSTTEVVLVGLGIAILLGMTLAVLMSQAKWIERTIFPYAVVVQAMPIIAIVPLIVLWFGTGFNSRVIVTVIIAIFPMLTNTLLGLKSAERNQHDLFTLHTATRWTRLRKLQFPAALPAIFAGLRISAALAVTGAIVGDFFFRRGQPGLGRLLSDYQLDLQGKQLITGIVFASLLGLALFTFFGALGNWVMRDWNPSTGGGRRS